MELWKEIENFKNYDVSTFGNIRNNKTNKILKYNPNQKGYYLVTLYGDIRKTLAIHRLVACAFIENEKNYLQVDHIDRNKTNNNVENLRWVTQQYNMWNKMHKNIHINSRGLYQVSYNTSFKCQHIKSFKNEQDAVLYLEQLKLKYPRIINT
tara:strand:- start:431 stop:886 length:456 start_codon:yes stop_codon:yes gene_type:complete